MSDSSSDDDAPIVAPLNSKNNKMNCDASDNDSSSDDDPPLINKKIQTFNKTYDSSSDDDPILINKKKSPCFQIPKSRKRSNRSFDDDSSSEDEPIIKTVKQFKPPPKKKQRINNKSPDKTHKASTSNHQEYNFKSKLFSNQQDHDSFVELSKILTNYLNLSPLAIQHIAEYTVGKIVKCSNYEECKTEEILLLKQNENITHYNNHNKYIFCNKCIPKLIKCGYDKCTEKDIENKMIYCYCYENISELNELGKYCRYHLDNKQLTKCGNTECDTLICVRIQDDYYSYDSISGRGIDIKIHGCQLICCECNKIIHKGYCSFTCANNMEAHWCETNENPNREGCNEYICEDCWKKTSCFGGCGTIWCSREEPGGYGVYTSRCDTCNRPSCRSLFDTTTCKSYLYQCKKCQYVVCWKCMEKYHRVRCTYKKCKKLTCYAQCYSSGKICEECNRQICKSHMNKKMNNVCNECVKHLKT